MDVAHLKPLCQIFDSWTHLNETGKYTKYYKHALGLTHQN